MKYCQTLCVILFKRQCISDFYDFLLYEFHIECFRWKSIIRPQLILVQNVWLKGFAHKYLIKITDSIWEQYFMFSIRSQKIYTNIMIVLLCDNHSNGISFMSHFQSSLFVVRHQKFNRISSLLSLREILCNKS